MRTDRAVRARCVEQIAVRRNEGGVEQLTNELRERERDAGACQQAGEGASRRHMYGRMRGNSGRSGRGDATASCARGVGRCADTANGASSGEHLSIYDHRDEEQREVEERELVDHHAGLVQSALVLTRITPTSRMAPSTAAETK